MVTKTKGVNVSKSLLIAYIVVSALFILMSMVSYMKNAVYNVWVQNWVATAINGVMQKAVNPKCEAFTLFSGKTEVGLVNIKCLQQPKSWKVETQIPREVDPEAK